MTTVFHEGETSVQQRAGVAEQANRLGERMVDRVLDANLAAFLAAQPFVVLGSGSMWASILYGEPGFARALSPERVAIEAEIDDADPLARSLDGGPTAIGLLVIDPRSRGRIRLNGVGQRTATGLEVELQEVFGNCTKYIQRRVPREWLPVDGDARAGSHLDAGQRALIAAADTFFVATRHPRRGADASHRGGRPGFVAVAEDGAALTFPDYAGNNMFQTLGNLAVEPAIGLLFVDWVSGRTLQVSGRAELVWDESRLAAAAGARRLVDVRVEAVVERPHGSALRWELVEAHRLNP
jgi:uncharacterized protein